MDVLLEPHNLVPLLALVGCMVSFAVGYYMGPERVKRVPVRVIPPELSRLARTFKITEDLPANRSYGRVIHDIIDEKDATIFRLEQSLAAAEFARDQAEKELAAAPVDLADRDPNFALVDYRVDLDYSRAAKIVTKTYHRVQS